ncbi:MAG: BON domain-containing protein [Ramlibacter sp.]
MRQRPVALLLAAWACLPAAAQQATNAFNDPFLQATSAIAACPVPAGPLYTPEQVRQEAHVRAQHGTSCYRSGRCRLPNSYLYDAEIAPRVVQYLRQDDRFADSSVWIIGRQRLVFLLGCAASKEQAAEMERSVGLIDDVMGVVNWLSVPGEAPRYPLAGGRR